MMKIEKVLMVTVFHVIMVTVLVSVLADEQFSETMETAADIGSGPVQGKLLAFEAYKRLFQHHRAMQLDAIKSIQQFGTKYEQRYKLVDTMVTNIFKVMEEAKTNLTKWGYTPGDAFPENDTIKEGVSKVLENTALFGDLALRLPDMVHAMYDKNKEWHLLIGWAVWFCTESRVFDGPNEKLLNLMSQELRLVPRDDDYINPFTEEEILKQKLKEELSKVDTSKSKSKATKKGKERRKGPRLSGVKHTEL